MSVPRTELVWLITGTSSGIGRDLTLEALSRGDKVIATSRRRSFSKLDILKEKGAAVLELDVTDPIEKLKQIAKEAVAIYGRVDVVVNNAGYILAGMVEETTPEETLQQFNTNVFGGLNVTRAFLPHLREKRTGTIVWIGSIGGWIAYPYMAVYNASKSTLRGISGSLHEEIAHLGLRSVCIDFGYFRTSFLESEQRAPAVSRIEDYKPVADKAEAALQAYNGKQPGDPLKGVKVIVDVLHGEGLASGKAFPTSLALGTDCYGAIKEQLAKDSENLEEWSAVSCSTDFDS